MSTKNLVIAGTFTAAIFSSSAWSSCEAPSTPTIPDPETAVTPLMIKSKNDVTAFMDAANTYLGCDISDQEHNDMVDVMNRVADDFNNCIKAFKARMAS